MTFLSDWASLGFKKIFTDRMIFEIIKPIIKGMKKSQIGFQRTVSGS
jgi:hypothetical protein